MNKIERLIYSTATREKKEEILGLWIKQAQASVTARKKELKHETDLLDLLTSAKHKIGTDIYDKIIVPPQPKIDWQSLVVTIKQHTEMDES